MNKKLMFSSESTEWETPPEVFNPLNKIFKFNLDVCATARNTKCRRYFNKRENGLQRGWTGNCFMNPPYGRAIGDWIYKASFEVEYRRCNCVVALLPGRVDTKWFQSCVLNKAEIIYIPGRIKFQLKGKYIRDKKGRTLAAPFPSIIAIWKNLNFK